MMHKLIFFLILFLTFAPTTAQNPPLFIPIETRNTLPQPIGALRSRSAILSDQTLLQTPILMLNLFDDLHLTATLSHIKSRPLNKPGYIWYGTIRDEPFSTVVLVIEDTLLTGQIILSGQIYQITRIDHAAYNITEIESGIQQYLAHNQQIIIPRENNNISHRTDSGEIIDLLVVYTHNAKAIAGGTTQAIEAAVESVVALTNDTFESSGVTTRLNIVHIQEVFYLEQPNIDFGADLNNLTGKTDGYMDEVHTLRDQYSADLVVLIAGTWFNNYCGTGWLPVPLDEAYGFSITEARCLSGLAFAHQIGHNMGSAHDRANADQLPLASYAYGYQDLATAPGDYADFVTIMASNTGGECPPILQSGVCPVIPRWSNPDQTYNEKPLGIAYDQPDAADNVRSLNETAVIVANYRASRVNLLSNGNFEVHTGGLPDLWTPVNLSSRDGVVCNTLTKTFAYLDDCAVRLTGGKDSLLKQNYNGVGLNTGDMLTLSAYVKPRKAVAGGFIRMRVLYDDMPRSVLRLNVPTGNHPYTRLSDNVTVTGTVRKIKVEIRYKGTSGRIFFDDIRLLAPPLAE